MKKSVINPACLSCDYKETCRKYVKLDGEKVKAKEQDVLLMNCVSVVEDICRDCYWFREKKCASWMILKGKSKNGKLSSCPSKVAIPVKIRDDGEVI